MRDDFRSAIRTLRASKTFAAVAVTVLALGIGATTAIFSVVESVVLRALPFDEPDRLVVVGERNALTIAKPAADRQAVNNFSPQNYFDVAADQRTFDAIAAVRSSRASVSASGGDVEDLQVQFVTSGYFRVLRANPRLGRTLTADDDLDGHDRVCVLSTALWRRRFGADAGIVGRSIAFGGEAYTVIGVLDADVANPMRLQAPVDLWAPYVPLPAERVRHENTRSSTVLAIARLKPGVSIAVAETDLDRIAQAMRRAYPVWNKNVLVGAQPLRDYLVDGRTSDWMLLLFGAVAFVLAIACANVANLVLARATSRERDVAVRAALGASRWRLVRQLLVESMTLSSIGAGAALVVAAWGVRILRNTMPASVPHVGSISVDLPAFAAAAALAVITGVLFGLAPALQASRTDVTRVLGDHARGGTISRRRSRFGDALVVVEVALEMVLLVGAALFIGSFRTVTGVDLGFAPDGVVVLGLASNATPPGPGAAAPDMTGPIAATLDALERVPGVVRAAFIDGGTPVVGLAHSGMQMPNTPRFGLRRITSAYFATMGIPVRCGRAFSKDDHSGSALTAILDESAARAFFPGGSAVGQTIPIDGGRQVVGVVGDVHEFGPELRADSTVYVPLAQSPARFGDLIVKTSGDPSAAVSLLRTTAHAMLPAVPVRSADVLREAVNRNLGLRRFDMILLSMLGGLGLVIAGVGIYGLLAYLVAQREREIGVRMALGASRDSVVWLVLRRASTLVGLGLAIGGFGAWALGGAAKAFLFRMNTGDPRVFAAAFGALVLAAAAATIIPARRAASVDPLVALRSE